MCSFCMQNLNCEYCESANQTSEDDWRMHLVYCHFSVWYNLLFFISFVVGSSFQSKSFSWSFKCLVTLLLIQLIFFTKCQSFIYINQISLCIYVWTVRPVPQQQHSGGDSGGDVLDRWPYFISKKNNCDETPHFQSLWSLLIFFIGNLCLWALRGATLELKWR